MPAPGQSTFDGNPNANPPTIVGYRPGLPDFNGGALTDDGRFPPDPSTMPTAALFNTIAAMLVSLGRASHVGGFAITAGASPVMSSWWAAGNNIASGSNPFSITKNGPGDYSITWPAGLFPTTGQPHAWLNVQLTGGHSVSIGAVWIANGVRVTTTQDTTLTDLNFSVALF